MVYIFVSTIRRKLIKYFSFQQFNNLKYLGGTLILGKKIPKQTNFV